MAKDTYADMEMQIEHSRNQIEHSRNQIDGLETQIRGHEAELSDLKKLFAKKDDEFRQTCLDFDQTKVLSLAVI